MCSLSLENVDCGPFCNDALEVEDKVCELQKKNDNPRGQEYAHLGFTFP